MRSGTEREMRMIRMAEKKKASVERPAPASNKQKALETALAQIEKTYG